MYFYFYKDFELKKSNKNISWTQNNFFSRLTKAERFINSDSKSAIPDKNFFQNTFPCLR